MFSRLTYKNKNVALVFITLDNTSKNEMVKDIVVVTRVIKA